MAGGVYSTNTKSNAGGSDGFWSTIGGGLAQGIARIGSDVLPRWVGSELNLQTGNQLNDSTYQQPTNGAATTLGSGTFSVGGNTLLIGGIAAVAAGILVYMVAK